jgi:hypothetical protein
VGSFCAGVRGTQIRAGRGRFGRGHGGGHGGHGAGKQITTEARGARGGGRGCEDGNLIWQRGCSLMHLVAIAGKAWRGSHLRSCFFEPDTVRNPGHTIHAGGAARVTPVPRRSWRVTRIGIRLRKNVPLPLGGVVRVRDEHLSDRSVFRRNSRVVGGFCRGNTRCARSAIQVGAWEEVLELVEVDGLGEGRGMGFSRT